MASSTGMSERIGGTMVALQMHLFTHGSGLNERKMWVWSVSADGCAGKEVARIAEVTIRDLEQIKRIADEHIKMIRDSSGEAYAEEAAP